MKDSILFTEKLWKAAEKYFGKITSHPFCVELSKGILSKERFNEYISQDSIYIIGDARALAMTAVKAEDADEMMFLLDMAMGKPYVPNKNRYGYSSGRYPVSGYDSTWAKPGCGVINDERIVYNVDQVNLKYLIEFKR